MLFSHFPLGGLKEKKRKKKEKQRRGSDNNAVCCLWLGKLNSNNCFVKKERHNVASKAKFLPSELELVCQTLLT